MCARARQPSADPVGVPGPAPVGTLTLLAVIAAGGAVGALARAVVLAAVPHHPAAFPWSTFAVNAVGCLLVGALMAGLARSRVARPLLRPFLAVGVLGGFTTFSTYVLDVQQAVLAGAPATALVYLGTTVLVALAAVWAGDAVTGWLLDRRRRGGAAGPTGVTG